MGPDREAGMTAPLEFNARPVPPSEVARSFIPPEQHFAALLGRNHTLVVGPRGSGKTTLFKMLTVKALRNWQHAKAAEYTAKIGFNAVFVPADITWGKQLSAMEKLDFGPERKESAFVIHTLRALIRAMREATDLEKSNPPSHLSQLAVKFTPEQEGNFVKLVVDGLNITPVLNSLLGVENALETLLDKINSGERNLSYGVETLPSKLSIVISAFNSISGYDDRRWAFLFDEMEIAPTRIKNFLLSGIRSFDERIIIKLALAPYMDDAYLERTPTSAHPLHDYQTVQLTYPNKEDAAQFTNELFLNTFLRLGFEVGSLSEIFSSPPEDTGFARRSRRFGKGYKLPPQFLTLAEKDESFALYIKQKRLLSQRYIFNEINVAQDIRKVLPIVIARDYYLKKFENDHAAVNRSRKSHLLYTGYPSIAEITEGNPRAILTLVTPLVHDLGSKLRDGAQLRKISTSIQSQSIRRVELLLTSLLQVIPLDIGGFARGKGLLDFVDQVGFAFGERLLRQPFKADYVGTFNLDENVSASVVNAVGKALNAGAIIHVPNVDSGPDILLRGLKGQRFRLSYALSARYRLLLTLGDAISLSKLLMESRGLNVSDSQGVLFEGKERNDNLGD
jgi:hypothetical protein